MRPKTYNQVLLRDKGNSYLGRAAYLVGDYHAQAILSDLKAGSAYLIGDDYQFFAYALDKYDADKQTTFILLGREKTPTGARAMMDGLPTETILVHFGTEFLHPEHEQDATR